MAHTPEREEAQRLLVEAQRQVDMGFHRWDEAHKQCEEADNA